MEQRIELINGLFDRLERRDLDAAMAAVAPVTDPEIEFSSATGSEVDGRAVSSASHEQPFAAAEELMHA